MFIKRLHLFGYILCLISIVNQWPSIKADDETVEDSAKLLCSKLKCSTEEVCTLLADGRTECVATATGTKSSFCNLPPDTGFCRGHVSSYFYNAKTDSCESFVYGGCKGNKNRFQSIQECEQICKTVASGYNANIVAYSNNNQVDIDHPEIACPKDSAGKAPEGCQWVPDVQPNGCVLNLLNCTEGPCVKNSCKECEYCINKPTECDDDNDDCPQYVCQKNSTCESLKPTPPSADVSNADICLQEPATGRCRGAFARYFFNKTSKQCETFTYGGCGGNENRFENQEQCVQTCQSSANNPNNPRVIMPDDVTTKLRICHLPPIVGPCNNSSATRWYYEGGNGCKEFTYGGCEGNSNNFQSKEACENSCAGVPACPPLAIPDAILEGCVLVPEVKLDGCKTLTVACTGGACSEKPCTGRCDICVNEVKQCADVDKPCPQYTCYKNDTCLSINDAVVVTPPSRDPKCLLSPETGRCRAAFQRWYFNATIEKCDTFVYGGCKGNENRFETEDECQKACENASNKTRIAPDSFDKYRICRKAVESGTCTESTKRWFYEAGECREFDYTGCGGNENNFDNKNECLSLCDGVKPCPMYDAPLPIEGCKIATYNNAELCPMFHYKCTDGPCASRPCSSDCENCVNEPKLCKKLPCPQYRCERNESCIAEKCTTLACDLGVTCDVISGSPKCVTRSAETSCNGNVAAGTCLGRYPSFYYDLISGSCQAFTYTGCEGNANRFGTLKTCQEICIRSAPSTA